ncbi:hypothetical protein MACH15_29150 [Maricaulis maris]|nr:hypothetical protein MACH15_29150 [Maricaulis maris]
MKEMALIASIKAMKAGLASDRFGASSASMKTGPSWRAGATASAGQDSTIMLMGDKIGRRPAFAMRRITR